MKRIVQLFTLVCCSASWSVFASVVISNNFNSANSFSSSSDAQASPLTVSAGVTIVGQTPAFVTKDWPSSSSAKVDQYIQFTVTPTASFNLVNINSLSFTYSASQVSFTGGRVAIFSGTSVSTTADPLTASVFTSTFNPGTAGTFNSGTLNLTAASGFTIRLYGFSANAKQDELTFDDIFVTASGVSPVPEPVNVALILFALGGTGLYASRRWMVRK